jgi:hypothetical protein
MDRAAMTDDSIVEAQFQFQRICEAVIEEWRNARSDLRDFLSLLICLSEFLENFEGTIDSLTCVVGVELIDVICSAMKLNGQHMKQVILDILSFISASSTKSVAVVRLLEFGIWQDIGQLTEAVTKKGVCRIISNMYEWYSESIRYDIARILVPLCCKFVLESELVTDAAVLLYNVCLYASLTIPELHTFLNSMSRYVHVSGDQSDTQVLHYLFSCAYESINESTWKIFIDHESFRSISFLCLQFSQSLITQMVLDVFSRICVTCDTNGAELRKLNLETLIHPNMVNKEPICYCFLVLLNNAAFFTEITYIFCESDHLLPFLMEVFEHGSFRCKDMAVLVYSSLAQNSNIDRRVEMMTNEVFDRVMDILPYVHTKTHIDVLKNVKFAIMKSEMKLNGKEEIVLYLRGKREVFEGIVENAKSKKSVSWSLRILEMIG